MDDVNTAFWTKIFFKEKKKKRFVFPVQYLKSYILIYCSEV